MALILIISGVLLLCAGIILLVNNKKRVNKIASYIQKEKDQP